MNDGMDLTALLAGRGSTPSQRRALFALLNLGIVESLANGLVSAAEASRLFFHAENCLFVRKIMRDKTADEIMSRGVQLSDLFELLPTEEVQREFQHELTIMRMLCLRLLEKRHRVA